MGLFALVAHTHLPYVRRNGVWPMGEDLFHQAAAESYLPMLEVLERLGNDGIRDAFTIGLSPMVATQLADEYLLDELGWFLGRYEPRAMRTVANYGRLEHPDDPPALHRREVIRLAGWHAAWARRRGDQLDRLRREHGDLARAFAAHRDVVELLGGPATHPLLPLVSDPGLQSLQLSLGLAEGERLTGRRPAGIWLPECCFAPDSGLEALFDANDVSHLVLDGPTVIRAMGKPATFRPWRIKGSNAIAFGRDLDVTYRVWSPTGGYPSGDWYRDFFHYDLEGGFRNWRVTGVRKPLHRKRPYEPEAAIAAARADAADFVARLMRRIETYERETGRVGLVVAAYDTELFGHWWFEGPAFLEEVIRLLATTPGVRPVSLTSALERLPEPEPAAFDAGSWGFRKDLRSWIDDATQPMRDALAEIEAEVPAFVAAEAPGATPGRSQALAQLLRETLLAQASDWPFKVVRGGNPDYGWQRFETHRARIDQLEDLVRSRAPDDLIAERVEAIRRIDDVFPLLTAGDLAR